MYIALRHTGPYSTVGKAFERLFEMTARHNVVPIGPAIAVYLDDPQTVAADQLRSEVAIPVRATYDLEHTGLHGLAIPAGKFIYADYIGPYSGLGEAWTKFLTQLESSELRSRVDYRWLFEEYLNDCASVGEPNAHTRLFCSLKSDPA